MKIVADENITYIQDYFGQDHELILKSGRNLTRSDVQDADLLLVRSVTQVNQALLQDTHVKFVGSVATGVDHLDIAWLNQAGIRWAAAEGCNATAVVEYVISVAAVLTAMSILTKNPARAAVIGVGRIGAQVAEKLKQLGFEVLLCDPVRANQDPTFKSTPLDTLSDLDLISLHTPLTKSGPYPTFHMIDKNFFQRQKEHCVLLNTGRGPVINFSDLKTYGKHLYWCLDVWENEPLIDVDVLQSALIATPHIAGYSVQSKQRGVEMIYQAAYQLGFLQGRNILLPFSRYSLSLPQKTMSWWDVILKLYDPCVTTLEMKNDRGMMFDKLRKNFPARYEFAYINIQGGSLSSEDQQLLSGLIN